MTFKKLSPKQKKIFKWAHGPDKDRYDTILCDGAVRSGKTVCMITSYILWAMKNFEGHTFIIAGKTVQSCERNIITPLRGINDLSALYRISYRRSDHLLTVGNKRKQNYFYVFGGKDESSQALIQGITASGVFLDEVALMPRSFVEQAIARTGTIENAKIWMNCNPENPQHFIFQEWIKDAEGENRKRILRLHLTMDDNPILSAKQIKRFSEKFQGVFYERYILGRWVKAEGLIYSNFGKKNITPSFKLKNKSKAKYYISIDYGTLNPFSAGLWAVMQGKGVETFAIRIKEFYYDARKEGAQKTDEEYYEALVQLANGFDVNRIVIDPSAASFITTIRRHGKFLCQAAKNDVLDGIRVTSDFITAGKILISKDCKDALREFELYVWDEKSHEDRPVKQDDHAMDDIRYFCNTILRNEISGAMPRKKTEIQSTFGSGWF